MRRALVAILASLLLAGPAGADLNPDQFADLRDRLHQLADALGTGNPDETDRHAAALRHWARAHAPASPLGQIGERASLGLSETEARQLRDALRQLAGNLDVLRARPADAGNLAAARETLARVLAADEYRYSQHPGWGQLLLWRAYRGLVRLMEWLSRIPGVDRVASVMSYIVAALLLLPLLGAIGYLIWWQARQRSAPQLETTASVRILESPETHLGHADDLLRQGHWLEALKQFHLAALAALEQRGLVAPDRTRTNWEYLAQLQTRPAPPESVSLLRALNALYDRAVFGTHPCDEPFAHAFGQQCRRLLETIAAGGFPR